MNEETNYNEIRNKVIETYRLKDSEETDVEEILERFLKVYMNQYSGFMSEIILKNYYEIFLEKIKPQIENLLKEKEENSNITNLFLVEERMEIEKQARQCLEEILNNYYITIEGLIATNNLTKEQFQISKELEEILNNRYIFKEKTPEIEGLTARHMPKYNFNYSKEKWNKIFENYAQKKQEIEKNIAPQMKAKNIYYDEEMLTNFDICLMLYKELTNAKKTLEETKGRQL